MGVAPSEMQQAPPAQAATTESSSGHRSVAIGWRTALVALAVVLVIGAAIGWTVRGSRDDRSAVRVVRGTVAIVDTDGTGIALGGEGYLIGNAVQWQGLDGAWRESGQPECLPALSEGAYIEFGVIKVDSRDDAPGLVHHVVWLKCLSLPRGRS